MRSSEKQSRHFYLMRCHSRAGGNPDLWLPEIFSDYRSVGFAHGYGLRQYRLRRVSYIFSRAKPTLRQPIADTRKSSEKTVPTYLPTVPSFPRRRESRPLIFRNIQRLPQRVLCPQIWFAEISVAAGLLIYSRRQSPRYGCRLQTPASRLKKYSPHTCQPRRHSRAGGNPDLWLPEIFSDYRSGYFAHGCEILVLAGRLCFTG